MPPPPSLYDLEATVFSALAHPTRLQILEMLRDGEVCVCHIQAVLGQRQAYVSQQLMALRQAGLVTARKEGLRVFYGISDSPLLAILDKARGMAQRRGTGHALSEVALTPRAPCRCPRCANRTHQVLSAT
jgi:ArsR family transcriptional regulator